MNKRVQRVENAACLGGISHTCNAKVNLYERFANDYLTVTDVCCYVERCNKKSKKSNIGIEK